jgi:hypothetical protein
MPAGQRAFDRFIKRRCGYQVLRKLFRRYHAFHFIQLRIFGSVCPVPTPEAIIATSSRIINQ